MGFKIKKSRIKQLIKEEYQRVRELGEPEAGIDVNKVAADAKTGKAAAIEEFALFVAKLHGAADQVYQFEYELQVASGRDPMEAKKLAEVARERLLDQAEETLSNQGAI